MKFFSLFSITFLLLTNISTTSANNRYSHHPKFDNEDLSFLNRVESQNYNTPAPLPIIVEIQEKNYPEPPDIISHQNKPFIPVNEWAISLGWGGGGDEDALFGGGIGLSYLRNRKWGFDTFFRGYGMTEDYDKSRDMLNFGINFLYYFSTVKNGGLYPYVKLGGMIKINSYYHEETYERTLYREEFSKNIFMGAGFHYRLPGVIFETITMSLNLEGTIIASNSEEEEYGKSSVLLLNFFFGIHF
ncbi:MAG: hypothetical protein PF689_04505 [Deltaproteobacteria bacterium]|jgi:hypothetical protein|nr:hypothetical protein [Deltaproteobacteria bacterium]